MIDKTRSGSIGSPTSAAAREAYPAWRDPPSQVGRLVEIPGQASGYRCSCREGAKATGRLGNLASFSLRQAVRRNGVSIHMIKLGG
jgi:hypothetical protein